MPEQVRIQEEATSQEGEAVECCVYKTQQILLILPLNQLLFVE